MNNSISLKDARLKSGLTVGQLSRALNLNSSLIELLENETELPIKYRPYRSTYIKSIFRYLGYEIPENKNPANVIYIDHTKVILTSFFSFFALIILVSSSLNIYNKFNNQISGYEFEKDEIYEEIYNFIEQNELKEISHQNFMNLLVEKKNVNYSNNFILYSNILGSIYYKIKYIDKKTIEFGELLKSNNIAFDLNNDFLIDLSNIANIEKIVYRGIEIKIKNNDGFYLKDFNINNLEKLL